MCICSNKNLYTSYRLSFIGGSTVLIITHNDHVPCVPRHTSMPITLLTTFLSVCSSVCVSAYTYVYCLLFLLFSLFPSSICVSPSLIRRSTNAFIIILSCLFGVRCQGIIFLPLPSLSGTFPLWMCSVRVRACSTLDLAADYETTRQAVCAVDRDNFLRAVSSGHCPSTSANAVSWIDIIELRPL